MSTLIAVLPDSAPTAASLWAWALTPDGRSLADHGRGTLADLPRADETVLAVPAQALSWHPVVLPRAPAKRLRAALEGLLEEQLLDEVQAVHLAVPAQARPGEPCSVAACERAPLLAALQALEDAQRPVNRIVPELWPQDGPAPLWITGQTGQPWALQALPDGVACLPLAAWQASAPQDQELTCLAEPAVAAAAEQTLGRKLSVALGAQRLVDASRSPWDLAQFDLVRRGGTRHWLRLQRLWNEWLQAPAWRPARWGLLAVVAVNLIGLNAWAWKEEHALQAKRQALQTILQRSFPAVQLVIDAPLQMAREVQALRRGSGQAGPGDLETLLASLALALPEGRSLQGIEFNGGELSARIPGLGPSDTSALQTRLQPLGYSVRVEGERLQMQYRGTP